jgi:hypothetical protein
LLLSIVEKLSLEAFPIPVDAFPLGPEVQSGLAVNRHSMQAGSG